MTADTTRARIVEPHEGAASIPIRPLLALMSLLASGPLMLLLISGSIGERTTALSNATRHAESLAVLGAEQQDDVIQEASTLLRVLAKAAQVRALRPGPCHALLKAVEQDHPHVGTISAVDLDGHVVCSSRQAESQEDLSDRDYFQRAKVASFDRIALSELVTGQANGQPTIIATVPIADPDHADVVAGVMIAALDLHWFLQLPNRMLSLDTNLVQIVDVRDGKVLAQTPPRESSDAEGTIDPAMINAFRAQPSGGALSPPVSGADRITGFAPLAGTQMQLVLAVSLSRSDVLAQANRRLAIDIATALAAAATAFVLAWVVANRSLLQPVRRLASIARRLGQGDLTARAGALPAAALELKTLGEAFDDMTSRLQEREAEVATIQAELSASEEHHRLLSTNATDMITRFDSNYRRTYVSPACRELIGYDPSELIGHYPGGIVHADDLAMVESTLNAPLRSGRATARATYRALRKDGRQVWLESGGRRLPNGDGFVVVTRDVTIRKEIEQQLEEANRLLRGQAMQDPLTGLANRRHFDEMLGSEFRRVQRLQLPLAVVMLDIDHFKLFNDTYGHPAGDVCINAVAIAIQTALRRPGDLAGRYGGEEFAILLPGTDRAGVGDIAERIRATVEELAIGHSGAERGIVTVSVGAAAIMPPIGFIGPAAFMEAADNALYDAKRAGRNSVRVAAAVHPASHSLGPDDFGPDLAKMDRG